MTNIDISLLDYNKSIPDNAKVFGIPPTTLKHKLVKLGIYNNFIYCKGENTAVLRGKLLKEKYESFPNLCQECGSIICYERRLNKFCSRKCSAIKNNRDRINNGYKISERTKKILSEKNKKNWKNGTYSGRIKQKIEIECKNCKNKFHVLESERSRIFCSRKCADVGKDMSHTGGIREGSGRGKSGWYRGYYCSSSWELAWVIYSLEHNLTFSRNLEGFEYVFKDKTHKFFPDFKLEDNSYVEVKGYETEQWKAKLSQFPHKIKVLSKEEMKPILTYVTSKYGSDYIKLYERNPHN